MGLIDTGASTLARVRTARFGWIVSFGPGAVIVLTALGPGDLVSNSAAAATYGYSLLWALALAVLFRFVILDATARYVLVTGETLLQGYSRSGKWVVWVVLATAILRRFFSNLYQILLMGVAAHLLLPLGTEWSRQLWSTFFATVGFSMVFWGGYPAVERLCKILIVVLSGSLLVAAALSKPDFTEIFRGALIPTIPGEGFYSGVLLVTALIGAQAGSLGTLTYSYFVREKGWRDLSYLRALRSDVAIGACCLFFMGAVLQIAAAGTLRPLGLGLESGEDLVRIFTETQGFVGMAIFGFGLWAAAFSSFVTAGVGYGLIVTDICRRFVGPWKRTGGEHSRVAATQKDPIYRWMVVLWSAVPLSLAWLDIEPIRLVIMVNAVVIVVLPILGFVLFRITNNEELMGEHKNGVFSNAVIVVSIAIAVYLVYLNGIGLWSRFVDSFIG